MNDRQGELNCAINIVSEVEIYTFSLRIAAIKSIFFSFETLINGVENVIQVVVEVVESDSIAQSDNKL